MCEIMKQLQDEGRAEGITESFTQVAIRMLKDNKPYDEITKYTPLSLEELEKLAQHIQ